MQEFVIIVDLPTDEDEQARFLTSLRGSIPEDDLVQHGDTLEVWWEQESQSAALARTHVEKYVRQSCDVTGIDFEAVEVRIKATEPQE